MLDEELPPWIVSPEVYRQLEEKHPELMKTCRPWSFITVKRERTPDESDNTRPQK